MTAPDPRAYDGTTPYESEMTRYETSKAVLYIGTPSNQTASRVPYRRYFLGFRPSGWTNCSMDLFSNNVVDEVPHPKPEGASTADFAPTPPSTGSPVADARWALWRVATIGEMIEVARRYLPGEIVARLQELWFEPYDPEQGDRPLGCGSVRWFLDYCLRRGVAERPLMTVTPDGLMQADWRPDKSCSLTIRFFEDGTVWLAIRSPDDRGSWEMRATKLLTEKARVRIPEWA